MRRMLKDPDDAVRDAEEAARSSGGRPYRHLMMDMTQALRPRLQGLPNVAAEALEVAEGYWQQSDGAPEDLVSARVACWEYLDAKNGSSAVVEDQEDHLVRAVICILFEEDENSGSDLWEVAHDFREFLAAST